ncbi:MAG: DUF1573 domain-containing protein [Saprospiraceae bacterium]
MNKLWLILPLFVLTFVSCDSGIENGEEGSLNEYNVNGENSDLIRNPISAEEIGDTVNVAKIQFETPVYDFGTVEEGEEVEYVFKFKNTGKKPLIIKSATATCGCTVPKPSKKPIAPGETGEIPVTFDSKGRGAVVSKTITVTSNAYPNQTLVKLVGKINLK